MEREQEVIYLKEFEILQYSFILFSTQYIISSAFLHLNILRVHNAQAYECITIYLTCGV